MSSLPFPKLIEGPTLVHRTVCIRVRRHGNDGDPLKHRTSDKVFSYPVSHEQFEHVPHDARLAAHTVILSTTRGPIVISASQHVVHLI